jgi:hypothetical protein
MAERFRLNNSGFFYVRPDGTLVELKMDTSQTLRPGNKSPSYKLEVKEIKND